MRNQTSTRSLKAGSKFVRLKNLLLHRKAESEMYQLERRDGDIFVTPKPHLKEISHV